MDVNKIQAKLDALKAAQQNQGSGNSAWKWKPKPDPKNPKESVKYTIRILPNPEDPDDPFTELKFYYEFGKTQLAPCFFGHPDPILEFANQLKADKTTESWKLSRKLEAKDRYFAAVLVRGEEDKGPRYWDFAKTIYTELLTLGADPDYTGYESLKDGRDITVEYIPAQKEGAFPETKILCRPKTSPATTDKDVLEKIKEMKPVLSYFEEPSYDDLVADLEKYLNPDLAKSEAKPKPAATGVTTTKDVDDAFDDMFKD